MALGISECSGPIDPPAISPGKALQKQKKGQGRQVCQPAKATLIGSCDGIYLVLKSPVWSSLLKFPNMGNCNRNQWQPVATSFLNNQLTTSQKLV